MKRILIFLVIVACGFSSLSAREKIDSLVMPVGTDTMYTISTGLWGFRGSGYMEFVYTDLTADDATINIGVAGFISTDVTGVGGTFNSYGDVLGVSLPYTLDVTTNTHSYTSEASLFLQFPEFLGTEVKIYITRGSCVAGEKIYIKHRR